MSYLSSLTSRLKNSKLANDSFWAIFGNAVGKGFSLLTAIIIARILGKELYGEYGIVSSTIGAILIFSNFGLNFTSTKYIAEYNSTQPEILSQLIRSCQTLTLIFSGLATIILFALSEEIATSLLKLPKLAHFLQVISIGILIGSVGRTQVGILAGLGKFKELAKINTFIGIGNFIFGVTLTYFYGLLGACLGLVLVQFIHYLFLRYYIRKFIAPIKSESANKVSLREILNFSTPVALQEALYSILTYATGLLLVQMSTYGEVGLSSAATYWSAIILYIPGILRNVILSHLSANLENIKARIRMLRIILAFNFGVTFLLSLIVYLLSDYIAISYGDNFSGLKEVLNICVFTTIFTSMSNVYAQAYMSENKNWLMLLFRIIRDGSIFLIAYLLLKEYNGLNGALSLAKSALWANILFLILMGLVYELNLHRKLNRK
ncbi:oligosaccharide flippase family protein [Arenibacter lacus]|uniref:oligosaccharide flippase family protein n=1 Tax=Arenibacter lacus TaxID=2608629 RepID=UPI00123D42D8|nr:oligosaccharide flippase family protein [Arenibacter lacus]